MNEHKHSNLKREGCRASGESATAPTLVQPAGTTRESGPPTNGSLKGGLLPAYGGVKQATATMARRGVFASRAVRVQDGGPSTARVSSEGALVLARPRGVAHSADGRRDWPK